MSADTSRRDPNYVTTIMGVDLSTGLLPTNIYVDDSTHRMLVNAVGSGNFNAVGNAASGATDSGNPVKVGGKYNVSAPTFTDGQRGDFQIDANGNQKVTSGAVEVATPFNAILNDVDTSVKASAGYLLSIALSSINAAIRYFQIHNKATAPAGADVPVFSFPIGAGSATVPAILMLDETFFGPGGYFCSTGISVGISTTAATFTAATTSDHCIGGFYV